MMKIDIQFDKHPQWVQDIAMPYMSMVTRRKNTLNSWFSWASTPQWDDVRRDANRWNYELLKQWVINNGIHIESENRFISYV